MSAVDGRVVRIVDGDTLVVKIRVRARNDAPELASRAGRLAAAELAAEFPIGSKVQLSSLYIDNYGRLVAAVQRGET